MKTSSGRPSGRPPMTEKRERYARLLSQGLTSSAACRELGIDRKTAYFWTAGRVVVRDGVTHVRKPVVTRRPPPPVSLRYLGEEERIRIADGVRAGQSARTIASGLGRAVSTVARELARNRDTATDSYRPHEAHARMLARRPRSRQRRLAVDAGLRSIVQSYLDQRWSPEQISQVLRSEHDTVIAAESIYQALYDPARILRRDPRDVLRRHRPYRRRRRRADERFGRFVSPLRLLDERPAEADDRLTPGHWEGDLVIGSYNRSAIGTLVERSTRFSILVHLEHPSRAMGLREELIRIFNLMPPHLRRSLTWDQGTEMCHHQQIADATGMPVYFCRAGHPWERATNENTNGLLRDYFPKGTNLRTHTAGDLQRVADELNRRPRKTLGWRTPKDLFVTLRGDDV